MRKDNKFKLSLPAGFPNIPAAIPVMAHINMKRIKMPKNLDVNLQHILFCISLPMPDDIAVKTIGITVI
uniref:Uncharacterized protein n=1 Tax=uncultured bacterium contig00053 TaxID=1181537 RepID=A0A806JYA9_9BACT|nr:hypothetical protein [uncultured bacterium contig00053]